MPQLAIQIVNHMVNDEPKTIQGSYQQVEQMLRKLFPDHTRTIPLGDLYMVLREVARAHAIQLGIVGGQPPQPQPHLYPRPTHGIP